MIPTFADAVIVPDELTDADLDWVTEQLEPLGVAAARRRDVDAAYQRARATGRRPSYLSAGEVRRTAGLPEWFTGEEILT